MFKPDLSHAQVYAADYTVVPLSFEMLADIKTPIQVLKSLKTQSPNCFLLESVEGGEKWGRYSFIGVDPVLNLKCRDGIVTVIGNGTTQTLNLPPHEAISSILQDYKSPKINNLPPFTGGFVGYFAYDTIKYSEKSLKLTAKDDAGFDDINLMLFDKIITFDHLKQKMILIVNIKTDALEDNYAKGVKELEKLAAAVKSSVSTESEISRLTTPFAETMNQESYCQMVRKAKQHIYDGDIFQVVLSNRYTAKFEGSLLNTYRVLRTTNPSPYMFYLNYTDLEITGASPETLVKLQDGELSAFPIAGTRPRGKDEEQDEQLKTELLADEKEQSEHNMLVDLARNDLGKLSEFGTVKVKDYMKVHMFSHVMHITSKVTGRLKKGFDQLDVIASALPAGTLSGAPKIRACEIIDHLEGVKRGVYGGAIGYIDFSGNMDMCIAIRMAVKKGDTVYVQAGAGIVYDSVPEREYEECQNKAKAMLAAFELSEGVNE